jgi:hypothetical protein
VPRRLKPSGFFGANVRAEQATEKLDLAAISGGFVTGHDFSRADKANQINVGLQPLQNSYWQFARRRPFFRSL